MLLDCLVKLELRFINITPSKVRRFQYGKYGLLIVTAHSAVNVKEIGKTVFLSYEDAVKYHQRVL